MTYLPSLIKKIDDFVSLAESLTRLKKMAAPPPETWSMPDDPEEEDEALPGDEFSGLYPKVMDVINEINASESNEDIANELQLIAELYKKAIEINGGFKQVQDYIRRAMANIDMLIDESDGVIGEDVRDLADEVLEDLSGDLRQRAKSTVAPQANETAALQQLKATKDAFNSAEARAEIESQKSVYEKGKPGQETGHTIVRKTAETPGKYAKEIARLRESLQTTTDQNSRNNIEYLIATLVELLETMKTVKRLEGEVKVAPDDAPTVQAFKEATTKLEQLRKQRLVYRRKLNELILKDDQTQLRRKMYETRDPREKAWLEERIRLLDLRMNDKLLRKRDMIKALKAKINSSGTLDERGDFQALTLPEATQQALEEAYQAGSLKAITKADYDRARIEEIGKGEGRSRIPKAAPQRGGAREILFRHDVRSKEKDLSLETFPGMLKQLRNLNNTATADARKYIMRPKEKGDPTLEPYVEAVSQAIRKKDNAAKFKAVAALKEAIKSTLVRSESLKGYLQVLRLAPHFKKVEETLYSLAKKQDERGNWNLTEADRQQLVLTISNMNRLIELYATYYQTKGKRKFNEQPYPFFKGVVNIFEELKNYMVPNMIQFRIDEPEEQYRVGETPEETAEETPEETPAQQRMKLMTQLVERRLLKEGQPFDPKEQKRVYDRIRTIEKAKQHQRPLMLGRETGRGGWSEYEKQYDYDYSLANFDYLVHLLQEKINTALGTIKEKLTRSRFGGDPILKPYVDAVSKAIAKGDNEAKYRALKDLKEQISKFILKDQDAFRRLEKASRLVPHFRALKEELKKISKWQKAPGDWEITPDRQAYISEVVERAHRLQQLYAEHYRQHGQLDLFFRQALEPLTEITMRLENLTK